MDSKGYNEDKRIGLEGVRVNTPGFIGGRLFAVAHAAGKNAPETNVARPAIAIAKLDSGLRARKRGTN